MRNIYIDNLHIHNNDSIEDTEGIFINKDIQGLETPPIRVSRYDKEGEDGGFLSNQLYSSRLITIEGAIFNRDHEQLELNRRNLINALKIVKDNYGMPIPHVLYFTTLDNLDLQTNVYLKDIKMNKSMYKCYIDFKIDLIAPDFRLYSQSLNVKEQLVRSTGGLVVNCGLDVILPISILMSQNESINLINYGNTETYPIYKLYGEMSNPIIGNNTTKKYLSLNVNIGVGECVEINTLYRTIKSSGENIISYIDLTNGFPYLLPGTNNIFITSNSGSGRLEIIYRDAYLGI